MVASSISVASETDRHLARSVGPAGGGLWPADRSPIARFHGEGSVNGGGSVRLSTGGVVDRRDHGGGGSLLVDAFNDLTDYLDSIGDPRQKGLLYAASATRHQFYFDGNKRTAKLMESGVALRAERLTRPALLDRRRDELHGPACGLRGDVRRLALTAIR